MEKFIQQLDNGLVPPDSVFASVNSEIRLVPTDEKIAEGLAIHYVGKDQLEELKEQIKTKTAEVFEAARNNSSKQIGRCIAWGIDLSPEVTEYIEESILDVATSQNHGMIPRLSQSTTPDKKTVWSGRNRESQFAVVKHVGALCLNNQNGGQITPPNGSIYSLLSSPLGMTFAFGSTRSS